MNNPLFRATLTAAALLWGSTVLAQGLNDNIERAFEAAGYDDVEISRRGGQILVTAEQDGVAYRFTVDRETGKSTLIGPVGDDEDEDEDRDDNDTRGDDDADGADDDNDDNDESDEDDRDDGQDDDRDDDGNDDRDDDDSRSGGSGGSGGDSDDDGDDD
jgi:hypothetical protein